jgi:thioredoxin 1
MAISTVIHTNEHSIDRVLATGLPVVLAFWQRNQPMPLSIDQELDGLAQRYAGKALIAKVNGDDERALLTRFNPGPLPALLIQRGGKQEAALSGADMSQVAAWLAHLVDGQARPVVRAASPPPGNAKPLTLTDATFQQVINSSQPVLVDFWAPWCGPCRMVAPHVEQLAKEFQGRAVVGKLNVDENPQTAQRYNIMSIPALLIFKNGAVVDQMVGAQPFQVLQQRLARHA